MSLLIWRRIVILLLPLVILSLLELLFLLELFQFCFSLRQLFLKYFSGVRCEVQAVELESMYVLKLPLFIETKWEAYGNGLCLFLECII